MLQACCQCSCNLSIKDNCPDPSSVGKGVARVYFFTEALAEFQHVKCMIVWIWEVKRVACYARAETFTEAVASVASMVAQQHKDSEHLGPRKVSFIERIFFIESCVTRYYCHLIVHSKH